MSVIQGCDSSFGEVDGEEAAWVKAWDEARSAAGSPPVEDGWSSRNTPPRTEAGFSCWTLGRHHTEEEPQPYYIRLTATKDGAVWTVEDIAEPDAPRAPDGHMAATPVRTDCPAEMEYRRRWGFDLGPDDPDGE